MLEPKDINIFWYRTIISLVGLRNNTQEPVIGIAHKTSNYSLDYSLDFYVDISISDPTDVVFYNANSVSQIPHLIKCNKWEF